MTDIARGLMVGPSRGRRATYNRSQRTADWMARVARRPFPTADALVVVSTAGYFDVFPLGPRRPESAPAYRGVLAELGPTVCGPDNRLSVRPDSAVLQAAVAAWSNRRGAAAIKGELGPGRNGAD